MAGGARSIQAGRMGQPFVVVDAFTDRPFAGNPGAVCVLPGPADERWMRAVAAEMNLSETAFLHPEDDGYRLRWFTPTVEVNLCGHGTLASAHVLWESERVPRQAEIRFATRSGLLTARRDGAFIELDFPAATVTSCPSPAGLAAALGAEPRWVGKSDRDYLVELPSEAAVRALDPDFRALAALPLRVVMVTAPADAPPFDFVSRFFAPGSGINEDPVTGSAHCALGPFWAARLGKTALMAHQASPRGGSLRVTHRGARVILGGQAVTVTRGEIVA
jgi:PhzF family phenazine biosynthesis protein